VECISHCRGLCGLKGNVNRAVIGNFGLLLGVYCGLFNVNFLGWVLIYCRVDLNKGWA
jgi:hypothetical protein